ncbi:GDP-mannose 4,6-dehydratase [Chelativorans sp. J32]|uniref:GDP-mannose 4,6-dehydratase n=1 Tax=Chelativorans sp. J32 TaxID=935840 RepID=UPI000482262D|nr:GDP-mannose 4,6-dehydratase [Chelativorans sp. J32]
MRVLITGAGGFVGPHVVTALKQVCDGDLHIISTSRRPDRGPSNGLEALDITDRDAVERAIRRHRPDCVVHLAGVAAPALAARQPEIAWRVNVQGSLNVASAIMKSAPDCWLIHAGSGLVYGDSAKGGHPLDETTVLSPVDDYGVTKASADLALGAMARRGLKCVRLRPFNHAGPGQTEAFVVSAFAMQVARIEAGLAEPVIRVGNLEAERDFLDVRDVAISYALVAQKAGLLETGTILNIASGKARPISDVLEGLLHLSKVSIKVEQDPARMRASDLPRIVGNAERAQQLLGWKPHYLFEQTLADVLADCRARTGTGAE